jgi:hypothetical protein
LKYSNLILGNFGKYMKKDYMGHQGGHDTFERILVKYYIFDAPYNVARRDLT